MTAPAQPTPPAQPKKTSPLIITLAVLGGFLLLCCVGGLIAGRNGNRTATGAQQPTIAPAVGAPTNAVADAPTEAPAAEPTAEPTEAPTEVSAATSFGMNQDAKVGDVRWKFTEATNVGNTLPKEGFVEEVKTSGVFLKVRFEIENQGTEQLNFTSIDLKDNKGRTFKASSEFRVLMHIPNEEQCVFEQLNPNIVKSCTAYFEIPADAAGIQAIIGDLALIGAEDATVDLGL